MESTYGAYHMVTATYSFTQDFAPRTSFCSIQDPSLRNLDFLLRSLLFFAGFLPGFSRTRAWNATTCHKRYRFGRYRLGNQAKLRYYGHRCRLRTYRLMDTMDYDRPDIACRLQVVFSCNAQLYLEKSQKPRIRAFQRCFSTYLFAISRHPNLFTSFGASVDSQVGQVI